MICRKITYTDWDGNERTEDFWFHLSQAEITKMELSTEGGIEKWVTTIVNDRNGKDIVDTFEKIILKAYGKKSLDGRRFEKSEELSKEFSETPAYDQLFVRLVTDTDEAVEFFNGIMPEVENPGTSPIPIESKR